MAAPDDAYGAITVGTSAVKVADGGDNQQSVVYIRIPSDSADMYVGTDASVTTSSGLPVLVGETQVFPLQAGEKLYAICGTASKSVRTLRLGQRVS